MTFYTPVELDQLKAAREQLETAIYLFLLGASPASVHTLAGAAQEVLSGLCRRKARECGEPAPITVLRRDDITKDIVGPVGLNGVRNYLKHCLDKSTGPVTVSAHLNMLWLYDCLESWLALGNKHTAATWLFFGWVIEQYSVSLPEDCDEELAQEIYEERGRMWPPHQEHGFLEFLREKTAGQWATAHPAWFIAALAQP